MEQNKPTPEVKVKDAQSSDSSRPHGLYSPWNSLGQNTGVGSLFLLQGIFPTQGLNPGLLHCRQVLCQLSPRGSPLQKSTQSSNLKGNIILSVQFSSVAQSCPTLCDPTDGSTLGLPVHHQLLEFPQIHVHRVGDAIQLSHPSSVVPFSSRVQSFPDSESFPISQPFTSGGQSIGESASASVLLMNIQD